MASSANQQTLGESSEAMDVKRYDEATKALRSHIGLAENPGETSKLPKPSSEPLFWIEVAPPSPRGAKCKLNCSKNILPGEYRIAVEPGQQHFYGGAGNSDFYHINCFENIADFSQAQFLDRVQPLTRNVTRLRNLKGTGILDGHYLLDAGAERLCLEWKVTVGRLIDKRDGIEIETADSDDSLAFMRLLEQAGSSKYVPKSIPGMSTFEFNLLSGTLAPFESDGDGDLDEWNLFKEYLAVSDERGEDLSNRHSLSQTLDAWRREVILATSKNPTDENRKLKEGLSPKATRAIRRLAVTPMPDFQSAFLGRSY